MFAAWYERGGPAADVLQIGEMAEPTPAPGEVRVRLTFSGINPGDTKKRGDWQAAGLPYARVIPHSDGAGWIDAVGDGVASQREGERVWVYGAQSYRPFGTAAQLVVVPAAQAVALPDAISDEVGACLGIPGITAHRAVFADGPVAGKRVLVHGVLGAVSSIAAQLAAWRGGAGRACAGGRTGQPATRAAPTSPTSTKPCPTGWRWTNLTPAPRSVARRRRASTASLRSRSPITPTSTPRSQGPRRSSPPTPPATHDRASTSGRCSLRT